MQIGIGILFVAAATVVAMAASAFVSLLLQLAATETKIPCFVHALHVQVVGDYAAAAAAMVENYRVRALALDPRTTALFFPLLRRFVLCFIFYMAYD